MILLSKKTFTEDIQIAKKNGFTVDFLLKDGMIHNTESRKGYRKNQCTLIEYCRYGTHNNINKASILFLIICNDGVKGFLSSNYSIHSNKNLMQFALSLKSKEQ